METASAPIWRASSTVATRIFRFESGDRVVLAERWRMRPRSFPYPRCPNIAAPRWTTAAFAPPSAIRLAAGGTWTSPGIGPTVIPWSIGTITVRRVFRSMIRSSRIFFPITVAPPDDPGRPDLPVDPADFQQIVQVRRVVGVLEPLLVLHFPRGHEFREGPVDAHEFLDVGLHHAAQDVDLPLP